MLNCFNLLLLAAEEQKDSNPLFLLLPPIAIIMVLWILMDSPQRRDRAKRDAMVKNLKKDDRVVTIGGILGSVANISQDGKEVTLKVDDGTRIRFRRSAIAEVLSGEAESEAAKPSS